MLASLGLALGLALPAQAVVPDDFTANQMCTAQATRECFYSDGTDGDAAHAKPLNNWSGEKITLYRDTGSCNGGYVTYDPSHGTGCPFSNSGFDGAFQGKEIVKFTRWDRFGGCMASTNANNQAVFYDAQCGTGVRWIWVPAGTTGFHYLVPVYETDQNGNTQWMRANGLDQVITTAGGCNAGGTDCQWGQS